MGSILNPFFIVQMSTPDLFSDDLSAQSLNSAHGLHVLPCTFSHAFWDEVVARMAASSVPLTAQLLVVPDGSMGLAYRQAWARWAQSHKRAFVMPRILTLMNWARAHGADDWDSENTARTLQWMQSLPSVPALLNLLAGSAPDDVLGLAQQIIAMSDELSVHLLAGRDVDWVKKSVSEVIAHVYSDAGHHLAQEELQVLLQCWSADVGTNHGNPTPVVQYLATLREMAQLSKTSPDCAQVWVLRNRAWTAHEVDFWHQLSAHARVNVLDITQIQVRADASRQQALQKISTHSSRYVAAEQSMNASIRVYGAANIEDEAQAVVQQVLAWREQDKNIALVALDRQVSRRVWALLQRVGVDIRDDTGWLLSTSRASAAWQTGLRLMTGEVASNELLDWMAHTLVYANLSADDKSLLVQQLQHVSDQQIQYQTTTLWRTWSDWQHAVHRYSEHSVLHGCMTEALRLSKEWTRPKSLAQWAQAFIDWAQMFGMWDALNQDGAGQKWCALMTRWLRIEDAWPMPLSTALRLLSSEVDALTYRPEREQEGRAETVVLMPLGNTRLREFDAVWLMGADAGNLPSAQMDVGLLNTAVRRALGLPNVEEKQAVLREALLDVLALNPLVCASYCTQKDGAPNGLSPWLKQYLRATGAHQIRIEHVISDITPQVRGRSASVVTGFVPSTISATALSSLSACPYQFYARQVLGIAPIAQPSDAVTPSEMGNAWHRVVEDFHEARAQGGDDHVIFASSIERILKPKCAENPRYWALMPVFNSYQAAFINWWQAREAQGWHHVQSEHSPAVFPVQTIVDAAQTPVHSVQWKGRIDQVDENSEGALALIDYKTNGLSKHKKQVASDEDVQLAFYVNLIEQSQSAQIEDALYVGVEKDTGKPNPQNSQVSLGTSAELHAKAHQLRAQVNEVFVQMCAGEPLRALGELSACLYCDYRAVCRKDYVLNGSSKEAGVAQ